VREGGREFRRGVEGRMRGERCDRGGCSGREGHDSINSVERM